MVFSSIEFLFVFLPIFLLAQIALPWNNFTFVIFSVAFYFFGEGWFVLLVLSSVVLNFAFGLAIDGAEATRRKLFLAIGVAANLLLLIFFKYAGFLSENLFLAGNGSWIRTIYLPLGISFFTFHALSYLIDVYRADARAERSLHNLALYILMFPQLIAGPILRYAQIAPQLVKRVVASKHVFYGLMYFVFGLGQKVLIADTCASIVDPLFSQWQILSTEAAWVAVAAYTVQIYFDFGGYSNMAIGLAMMNGFDFPLNFNFPYISQSITEFWRRWHISLSSWFRDYLYLPLGGNRHGALKTYRNLFIVFVLCGIWHGAAWTFLIWGLYHGVLLVIERVGLLKVLSKMPAILRHAYAIVAIMIGWVIFRSDSTAQALGILWKMANVLPSAGMPLDQFLTGEQMAALVAGAVFSTPIIYILTARKIAWPQQAPWPVDMPRLGYVIAAVAAAAVFFACTLKILTGSYSPFIYFRF
jgi:alginate O-acetyltransferase complex protein AlgI